MINPKACINRSANNQHMHVLFTYLICVLQKISLKMDLVRSSVTCLVQVQAVLCVCATILHVIILFIKLVVVVVLTGSCFDCTFLGAKPHD